jgi:predicted metal-dependent peptidase
MAKKNESAVKAVKAENTEIVENTDDKVLLRLNAAKVVASQKLPYLSTAIFSLIPIRTESVPYAASDAKWRLYYNPKTVMDWTVEEFAGVIIHEVGHCIRDHANRFKALLEPARLAHTYNIAGDVLINEDIRVDGLKLPSFVVYIEHLVKDGVPAKVEMSAEQIYRLLRDKADEQCTCGKDKKDQKEKDSKKDNGKDKGDQKGEGAGEGEGSGSGSGVGSDPSCPVHGHTHSHDGSGEPCGCGEEFGDKGWDCGSAADGQRRDYELEGEEVDKGIDQGRADMIRQHTAIEIEKHVRQMGHGSAGWARWAQDLLNPVVDWRKELTMIVRRCVALVAGLKDYTYRRPSRRQGAMRQMGSGIVLPAMRQPAPPKVSIVIDTSGSMSDTMLGWALTETQGVLKALGSSGRNVNVVSCDAAASSQKVSSVSQVKLNGGGGTDMRVGIAEAMKVKPAPDVIILITDGYTPYPDEPLKGTTLIVALTDDGAKDAVPDWARTVMVVQD